MMRRWWPAIVLWVALTGCEEQRAALLKATSPAPPAAPAAAPAAPSAPGCAPVEPAAATDVLVSQANDRAARGCWAEAEAAYATARRERANDAELRDRHARALLRLKRFDDANEIYRRADAERPDDIGILTSWGGLLIYADRPEPAVERFQQALRLNPDQPRTHVMLGWAYLMLERRDEAVAALREAERLRPGASGGLAVIGKLGGVGMLPRGRFPSMQVFDTMQQALARGPDGRRRAMAEFERLAAEQDQPATFYFLWGLMQLVAVTADASEAEAACRRFDQVLERDATHAWSHASCARALIQAGKLEPATARMDQALALAPDDPLMHAMYGEVLLIGKQAEAARSRLQDAERAFPDNPIISAYLAQALEATGDRPGAEAAAKRAEEKLRRQ